MGSLPQLLLLSLVFPPDSVSTASMMGRLAAQLRGIGHPVTVFTTTPHYNHDPEALAVQPLTPWWGKLLLKSDYHGIPVYHARVRAKGRHVLSRLVDYLSFHIVSTIAGWRLAGPYQAVLAPSPPLTIGLSAAILARIRNVPFIYNVQEIYPDIAVSLGLLTNRPLIRAIEWLERFIYSRAAAVVVISEDFRQRLLAKGTPAEKLHVIPNFVDVDFIQPGPRHNDFSRRHELDDRFVVLYAGNIGLTQDFDTVLTAAQALADLPEVCFLIVGDGARREALSKQVADLKLKNVRLLPYQPHSAVPQMYACSDACIIPMRGGTTDGTFPSKIYTIMAVGRPAVISADSGSDLARLVLQANSGLLVPPGDAPELARAIRSICQDRGRREDMGRSGRDFVVRYHSPEAVARQYHELLLALTRGKSTAEEPL